ncbi:MAG: cellulose biosynthesis cyclic di-GMP-binding regulatory protein BcsB [Phototrophicaceae bacterium]
MERIIESKRMTIGLVVLMGLVAILLMSVTTFAQDSTPEPAPLCELYSPIFDTVTVRSCAGSQCTPMGSLDRIDPVCVIDLQNGWYQIDTDLDDDASLEGFILETLLQPGLNNANSDEFEFCDAYQVIPEEAILRTCPSLNCNILDTAVANDVLCALDYDASYTNWIRIASTLTDSEWVNMADMVSVRGERACSDPWSVAIQSTVTRSCPQAFCGAVQTIQQGTEVCSIEESDESLEWIGVEYGDDSVAWVFAGIVEPVALASNEIFSQDEAILATLTAAAPAVAQDTTPFEFATVTSMPTMTATPAVDNGCYEYAVTVSSANIRENPSVEAPIITGVQEDALICVLGVVPYLERDWFIVDVNRGEGEQQIGFMAQNTVSAVDEVLPSPTPSPVAGAANNTTSAVELVTTPSVCNGIDCVEAVALGDPQSVDLTLTQLTRNQLELSSPQSSVNFRFVLPSDWSIQDGNRINLAFDYVELGNTFDIARAPSSQLDVRLNDELLSSYALDRDNTGAVQSIDVVLPADVLADEADRSHNLELVLTALDHCDANLNALLIVDKDASFMHVEYVELEPVLDLSLYPRPFFEVHPNGEIVYVVLPDEATASELTSASRVVAGLGSIAGRLDVRTRTVSSLSVAEYSSNNLILVGFPERHSLIASLYERQQLPTSWTSDAGFLDQANEVIAESDGILQVMEHPDDARFAILVVTGASDAAILKAGQALGGSPTGIGLQGSVAIVEDATPRVNMQSTNLLSTGLTLENLGFTDVVLSGLGEQSIFIEFFVPFGVTVSEEAYIELLYNNSAVLEDRGTTITIEVNDVPVASNVLRGQSEETSGNVTTRRLRASIPPTAIQAGVLNSIIVTLSGFNIDRCEVTNLNALWLTISRESQIFLPVALVDRQPPLVAQFPAPYNRVTTLSDVLVSIPDEPTPAELDQAMDLMFYLGNTGAGASGMNPQMVRGIPSEDLDLSAYHIITLGRPSNNSFFTVIGDDLPQPITMDDTLEQIYNNLIYRLDGSYEIGLLQVMPSPFNTDRDLLVITGTDDVTQALTIDKLLGNFDPFEMAGDVVFVSQQTTYPLNSSLVEQDFEILQAVPALATESAFLLRQTLQPVIQVAGATSVPVLSTERVANNEVAVEATVVIPVITPLPLVTPTPVFESIAVQELTPEASPRPEWIQYLVIGTAIAILIALISRVALSFRKKDN